MQPTNLVSRYDANRVVREDLSSVIEMVTNEETPFTSNIGRGKAEQTYFEWNTDALVAANEDNAQVEGDDYILDSRPATTRMGNYTQIMTKTAGVSGTLQAIKVIGGKKQLAREIMKAGRELKLDREKRFVGVKPAVAGNDTTARQTAGFGAFIRTNVSRDGGGSNPTLSGSTEGYPNAAPGDGSLRNWTEDILKSIMQQCWSSGGKPKMLMVGPALKVATSKFTGLADQRRETGDKAMTIIGAADVYLSDFGKLAIVPNPQMRARDAWFIDTEMVEMETLRSIQTEDLAKTGDSEKKMLVGEFGLKVNSENAHGAAADLQPA